MKRKQLFLVIILYILILIVVNFYFIINVSEDDISRRAADPPPPPLIPNNTRVAKNLLQIVKHISENTLVNAKKPKTWDKTARYVDALSKETQKISWPKYKQPREIWELPYKVSQLVTNIIIN